MDVSQDWTSEILAFPLVKCMGGFSKMQHGALVGQANLTLELCKLA